MSEIDLPPPSENRQNEPDLQGAHATPLVDRTCLLVLGMHRSGTSALTRLLSLAGAKLPLRLMPAGPGNESGHWEPLHLVEYHEKMLQELGSSWHDWQAVDVRAAPPKQIEDVKSKIKALIKEDYAEGGLYAVKDPRICRFAEFFIETIAETGDKVALIHAFRSPLDVVNSLNSRKVVWPRGYTTTDAALLWLRHVLDAEAACRGRRRALISFDFLMADPEAALATVSRQTGLTFEKSWADIEPEVRTFLSPNQRHHAFSVQDLNVNPDTRGWVETTFLALRDLESNPEDADAAARIAEVTARFNEACPLLARMRTNVASAAAQDAAEMGAEIDRLNLQLHETSARRANADAENDIASLKSQLAEAESLKSALSEEFKAARRLSDAQRLQLLQRVRELEVQQDLKSREILLLQGQITQTHLAYTTSTSWKVTRPLRAVGAGRNALRRAARSMPSGLGGAGLAHGDTGATAPNFKPLRPLYAPLVSVIVPNAGGAKHLKRRLSSVYAQDYGNFEVILLDDRTPDSSGDMMRSYRDGFAGKTTLLENSERQNAKFWQWQLGLSAAKGDLVWITDPNDWNEPNFLSALVPALRDEGILLAYSNAVFMTDDGSRANATLCEVLQDLDPSLWRQDFTRTAHHLVRDAWAKRNIVPTPSSALFRRQRGPVKAAPSGDTLRWTDMARCGDWLFYLNAARGGHVHFASGVMTYRSSGETAAEISAAAELAPQRERAAVASYCSEVYKAGSVELGHNAPKRMPSILMVGRAFTSNMHDTFPIVLANLLWREGYAVTFLCCHREAAHDGVRELLNPEIALLDDLNQLNAIVSDFGIDIVHTHHPEIDQEIMGALQHMPCAKAVTLHGGSSILQPGKRQIAVRNLEKQADALIYTSEKGLLPFREAGLQHSSKLHHIAGVLDDVPVEPISRSRLNVPIEAFALCLAIRATPQEGWTESILAVERARERSNLDIHLFVIGAGPVIERLRATHCERHFVHFLGATKNARGYFAACDMGLMPLEAAEESDPSSVIDCLAAGRPVLAVASGVMRDMISAEGELAGCLLEQPDSAISVESLANTIILCAADRAYYARMKAATAAAYAKFDPQAMLDRYLNVYQSISRA